MITMRHTNAIMGERDIQGAYCFEYPKFGVAFYDEGAYVVWQGEWGMNFLDGPISDTGAAINALENFIFEMEAHDELYERFLSQ